MATIYVRTPNSYYGISAAGSPDGSADAPYNYTTAQIMAAAAAGDTVKLHPACYFAVLSAGGDGIVFSATCPVGRGVVERWDDAPTAGAPSGSWTGIYPTWDSLEYVPSGAWVDAGSGNWRVDFDGSLGTTSRTWTAGVEGMGWGGVVAGKNDVRRGNQYTINNRRMQAGALAAVAEYSLENNGATRIRLTVKTGGANPTALWGSYAVHMQNGNGVYTLTPVESTYLTLRRFACWGGGIHQWPSGPRTNRYLEVEDFFHLMSIGNGAAFDGYPHGTASGATTNAAGYSIGATVITLASAGAGTIIGANASFSDGVSFDGDSNVYRVASGGGDADVGGGGTITLVAPGLLQAIPAANTAITVRKVQDNLDQTWRRITLDSGWPSVGRVVDNVLPQEVGAMNGVFLIYNNQRISFFDVRIRGYSHGQIFGAQQTARTERGLASLNNINFYCTRFDDPGDGHGAWNTLDCVGVDYQRGIGLLAQDYYIGPLRIINQTVQSQWGGRGVVAVRQPPWSAVPYSEGTLASSNYNISNGQVIQNAPSGGTLPVTNILFVGASFDATGNCGLLWTNDDDSSYPHPNFAIKAIGCLSYDAGQAKYRHATAPPSHTVPYPNAGIWASDNQTTGAPKLEHLWNNVFIKTAGGDDVIAVHQTSGALTVDPVGFVGYNATELNALSGWEARGNVQHASLAAAGLGAQGMPTTRLTPVQRGARRGRGYR